MIYGHKGTGRIFLGQTFSIEVEEASSAGFLCEAKFDTEYFDLLEQKYLKPKKTPHYYGKKKPLEDVSVGGPAKVKFIFLTKKSGSTVIEILQKRPWNNEVMENGTKTYPVSVEV